MHIFDIENKSLLRDVLLDNLKTVGVTCRLPKKIKENEKENVYSPNQIFQKPIHLLKKCVAERFDGSTVDVPEFLVDACSVIEKYIKVEGIFRKAGSTCKQKERKLELNQGKKISCEYNVLDACSLVKLFFRELPQPIIPFGYHDILLKCLLLSTYEEEVDALLLATMLLPEENIATLAFFMEFLLKVSQHAEKNKMDVKNLAIILTPNLMPLSKGTRVSNNVEMASHFKVIEMLIENAVRIGRVPDNLLESMISISNKKQKKKRRSSSLSRMFTGLKKIVSSKESGSSEWNDSVMSAPDSLSSARKRKNAESTSKLHAAKKTRVIDSPPLATPLRCRMLGYATSLHLFQSSLPLNNKRTCTSSLVDVSVNSSDSSEMRNSSLNLVRRCTAKRHKPQKKLASNSDLESFRKFETEKTSIERKLSLVKWTHKSTSFTNLFASKHQEDSVNLSNDEEFITVSKSEYEDIKNRVSALEEDLEKLATVQSVQAAFEKTLEESERLAKRLSKELNIRRSSEGVVRSPSARKIGSIRRRSREMQNSESKSSLRRGKPNTLQTGLPSPKLRTLSNENILSPVAGENWKSGETFFSKENRLNKLISTPQGRPSIAEIRSHNAGMVLEKAKLFNSLNEAETKIPRRQSVRLKNLRRVNENSNVSRTKSFGSQKSPKIVIVPPSTPVRSHVSRRDTPNIKKPLVVRSPRSFAKTPLGQRSRATPMKVLVEATAGTPHIGVRRSPRILARSINTPSRLRD